MDSSLSQWIQPLVAVSIGFLIAFRAHTKKSLSTSGALAGFFVMALHIFVGFRFGAMIFAFFFTSSALTKKGQDMKKKIDPEFKQGGQRNWFVSSFIVVSSCCCQCSLPTSGIRTQGARVRTPAIPLIHRVEFLVTRLLDKKKKLWFNFMESGSGSSVMDLCIACSAGVDTSAKRVKRQFAFNAVLVGSVALLFFTVEYDMIQVLSNSGIASVLVVAIWVLTEGKDRCLNSKDSALITSLIGGVIGHYSCSNGDTWSSEIGVLSDDRPRLITTFKPVRKGTNGGVTKTGLLAAAAGGSVIGLSYVLLELLTVRCGSDRVAKQLLVIPVATIAGLGGSIIDSLLGATLQFSGFCSIRQKVVGKPGPTIKKISGLAILDNNAVNFVSILLTTILTSIACLYIF
ncbi:transmembrane protein 19-like [Trifolium pratense]|uniref:Transmembrane protein 19-like n=1 Tax=Trifolium pratense TaxID=57577 RepID=A0A2K3N3K7_TRIPR|nr:transmembrane protein 19-like [Trifolium pratense]